MMPAAALRGLLIGCAALAAISAARAADAPIPYRADARLKVKMSVTLKDQSISAALERITRELKVPLRASAEVRDEKVSLFGRDRSAASFMTAISNHFDCQWKKVGTGYELEQTRAAQEGEERLRAEATARAMARIEARLARVADLLKLTPEQVQARLAQTSGPARTEEELAIGDARRRGADVAISSFRALLPGQLAELRARGVIALSSLDRSLTPATADRVHHVIEELMVGTPWQLDNATRQADLIFRLSDWTGPLQDPRIAARSVMRFEVGIISGDRQLYRPTAWWPELAPPERTTLRPPSADAMLHKPVNLTWDRPEPKPRAKPSPYLPLSELALKLAMETGLQVVTDSYTRARFDPSWLTGAGSAEDVLNRIADALDYTWSLEGDLLRLRSGAWFRDRLREVPDRVLAPWRRQVLADRRLTLPALSSLAGTLTDAQARGLHDFWAWYTQDLPANDPSWPGAFYSARHQLRLWSTLGEPQRQSLLAGETLKLADLAAPQQRLVVSAIEASGEQAWAPMQPGGLLLPEQLAGIGVKLDIREVRRQRFRVTFGKNSLETMQELNADGAPKGKVFGGADAEPVGAPVTFETWALSLLIPGRERPLTRQLEFPKANG
jgi:hypothetical protein